MKNYKGWQGESLVTAQRLAEYFQEAGLQKIPPRVLILDQVSLIKKLSKRFDRPCQNHLGLKILILEEKRLTLVAGLGLGGPAAAMTLELLHVLGATDIIHLGTAGAIQEHLSPGDLLVVDAAFRDEGTSAHYLPPGELVIGERSWAQAFGSRVSGLTSHQGPVWTTDAVFRETKGAVEHFRGRGALAVEMEAASLMAVASFLGLRLLCLRVISDQLSPPVWDPHFKSPEVKGARERIVEYLLNDANF